jgi:hypothetical protein
MTRHLAPSAGTDADASTTTSSSVPGKRRSRRRAAAGPQSTSRQPALPEGAHQTCSSRPHAWLGGWQGLEWLSCWVRRWLGPVARWLNERVRGRGGSELKVSVT